MSLEVNIKKKFKGFSLDVSFYHEGRCMGILGASGSGKSMTLKCIAGIEKPDEGKIVLDDKVLFDSSLKINQKPQQRKIGYLFQNYALFPNMTVNDNIGVSLRLSQEAKRVCIQEFLERFQLKGLGNRYPSELSGGQQQRVALARILAYYPDMILLDEPFSALDSSLRDSLQRELLNILEDYKGDVILVSHSRDEIYKFCDRLSIMTSGKQLQNGNTKDIFINPIHMEAARLTGCKNISPIKKIGDYELMALDWDIKLKTSVPIGNQIRYVGIRAHSIQPSLISEEENSMPIYCKGYTESIFENEYMLHNKLSAQKKELWWKVAKQNKGSSAKDRTLPDAITLPKEELMLLV
jgi:molybdate transport system ATP-binding protein